MTVFWTKATNRPDVSTPAKVNALVAFVPQLATSLSATWVAGPGDAATSPFPAAAERLVLTLSGPVNVDILATLVPAVRVSVLPGGGLQDAAGASQNASIVNATLSGTWGDASQPQFLATAAAVALDYGGQPGLGPGDALLLRFNQPVQQADVPVGSKASLDALLAWTPSGWAENYTGAWFDATSLLVTVVAVGPGAAQSPGYRASTAVGALRVAVRASGNLVSLDKTSPPSNSSAVVNAGSWGDPVCDGGAHVYSATGAVVAFTAPMNASYTPGAFHVQVSTSPAFSPGGLVAVLTVTRAQSESALALPGAPGASTLRYLVPGLSPDVPYYVRVAPAVPDLPATVDAAVQARLPLTYVAVGAHGSDGGCTCAALAVGAGCAGVSGALSPVVPSVPRIGAWVPLPPPPAPTSSVATTRRRCRPSPSPSPSPLPPPRPLLWPVVRMRPLVWLYGGGLRLDGSMGAWDSLLGLARHGVRGVLGVRGA